MEFRLYFEIHERGLISCLRSENIEFVLVVLVLDDNYCYIDFKCSMIFTRCVCNNFILGDYFTDKFFSRSSTVSMGREQVKSLQTYANSFCLVLFDLFLKKGYFSSSEISASFKMAVIPFGRNFLFK